MTGNRESQRLVVQVKSHRVFLGVAVDDEVPKNIAEKLSLFTSGIDHLYFQYVIVRQLIAIYQRAKPPYYLASADFRCRRKAADDE